MQNPPEIPDIAQEKEVLTSDVPSKQDKRTMEIADSPCMVIS